MDNNVLDVKQKQDLALFDKDWPKCNSYQNTVFQTRNRAKKLESLDISTQKIKQFNKAEIYHSGDLLNYFPRKYIDFSNIKTVNQVTQGELCSMIGEVIEVKESGSLVFATCSDATGKRFMACWFNQSYIKHKIYSGYKYIFCGKINISDYGQTQIMPTSFSRDIESLKRIQPVYRKITGMSDEYLSNSINKALGTLEDNDHLNKDLLEKFNLITKKEMYEKIHRPQNWDDIQKAIERIVFDRMFRLNFVMNRDRDENLNTSNYIIKDVSIFKEAYKKLPYEFTPDQAKSIKDMTNIMSSGKKLSALVQGDVGSGKTIVAFFLLLLTKANNFQGAMIAPTEVLAKQHYKDFKELVDGTGITCALLTGSTKSNEKKKILKELKNGTIDVLIGTHALIQDSVKYQKLGIVVIDEQHRFGVEQRNKLSSGNNNPHVVIMSATPIPRTLSMAIYGDSIQVFNIKTKPAGRKDVITKKVTKTEQAYSFIENEINKGKQAYIICPLITESKSEKMADVQSVEEAEKEAKEYFKDRVTIASINGKMKQADIEEKIKNFYDGKIDILISTTIVEVGVNVPNASVILIKNSERFGLAQSHQLRGRVGRSDYQSYCLLLAKEGDPKAEILCSSTDGFVIAKEDLKMRGSGDFIGTKQSGINEDVELMIAFPDLYQKIADYNLQKMKDNNYVKFYSFLADV